MTICVLIFAICFLYGQDQDTKTPTSGMKLELDGSAVDWDGSGILQESGGRGIKIPGYNTIYFPAHTLTVPITLYNPEGNICYFVFELYIGEKEEPVYTSGYVEPGKAVTQIHLLEKLSAGDYLLQIKINTYNLQTKTAMNSAVVKTDLIVR